MPEIYKVEWFFAQPTLKGYGWGEVAYVEKDTVDQALTVGKQMVPFRVALLGGGGLAAATAPRLAEVRVSDIRIQRDSLVEVIPAADGTPVNPIGEADNPNLSVLLRIESGSQYRRQWYIRGQPDSLCGKNGIYVSSGFWEALYETWRGQLFTKGFGIYGINKAVPDWELVINSVDLVATPPTITTVKPHLLADQDEVRILSLPGITGIKGVYRVQVIDANTVRLLGAAGAGIYRGGGRLTKRQKRVLQFTRAVIMGITKRSTGRPFDAPRGRRRVRRAS